MENASKALIMTGSVLTSLLVISLVVIGYNQLTEWQQTAENSGQNSSDAEFMLQIEQFNRELYGSELLSLMNFVENYNTREAGDGYAPIQMNVIITDEIDGGEFEYFKPGTYNIEDLYKEVNGLTGIEKELEKLERSESKYNGKSVKYYWSKTYREIASDFGIVIPSDTPSYELEETLLNLAKLNHKSSEIESLLEDIKKYDLLNSIYTQFREGKRFKPAEENGFVYDNFNGRVTQINFVEI